ncbi:MAG TPA: hypothetical protein DDW52_27765 [Planctomycetaceae bacterium]|nr:hypothetical protein [Planctomycetaceae bacterium]
MARRVSKVWKSRVLAVLCASSLAGTCSAQQSSATEQPVGSVARPALELVLASPATPPANEPVALGRSAVPAIMASRQIDSSSDTYSPSDQSPSDQSPSDQSPSDASSGTQEADMDTRSAYDVSIVDVSVEGIGNGEIPEDGQLGGSVVGLPTGIDREAAWKCVHWAPASICHYPLYFEDVMLERHGHQSHPCLQPLISGTKFFVGLPLAPYKQALWGPAESVYSLGHYRTGSPAPALRQRLPWDRNAAAVEALSLGGLFWAAPL